MTWKSYAAVSGATVLAGWLASSPPSNAPTTGAVASSAAPRRRAAAATDIAEQAARLQSRLQVARAYSAPQRNPFRFSERPSASPGPSERAAQVSDVPPEPIEVAPAGPRVSVAGIAEEQIDGRIERTAILSSPMGVLLVREGETILDYYRVGRIETESVELIRLSDGETTRFTFGAGQ